MHLTPPARSYRPLEGVYRGDRSVDASSSGRDLPAQGFRLTIDPTDLRVEASDASGLFYGRQTLAKILDASGQGAIPCCVVEDWPDFQNRAYLLDISRDRVPTMAHLRHLVDWLAALRYNQLQLYTEHTFAYPSHATVWEQASPMTGEEIRELDAYCRERHIELVPNQNSFGHMERWLQHESYKHLAECPEGFRHPISGQWRPQGSVLRPDDSSLRFLDGLYAELLPHFSSRKFNIGGDEPWELGWGASAARVEAEGKHRVYAEFLIRICELATRHGAEPMCWADVLLEAPDTIQSLPVSVQPVLWGYEINHPYEEQCARLAALGRSFYVAPGDSTWSSYTGRFGTMFDNVRIAAETGKKHGADGLLMTHWGDGGHPQAWPISLPGMVWAGLNSWRVDVPEPCLHEVLREMLHDGNGLYTSLLLDAGRLNSNLDEGLLNASYLGKANQLNAAELAAHGRHPDPVVLRELIGRCGQSLQELEDCVLNAPDAAALREELALMLRLNISSARRCLGVPRPDSAELREVYGRCWLRRSRAGGLAESIKKQHSITHE